MVGSPAGPRRRAEGADEARGDKPLCGGCGAKIGPDLLDRVLSGLPSGHRDDVTAGPGDDAAILKIGGAGQVLTADHLRAFWSCDRRSDLGDSIAFDQYVGVLGLAFIDQSSVG